MHIFTRIYSTGWSIPPGDDNGNHYRLEVTIDKLHSSKSFEKKDSFENQIPEFPTVRYPIAAVLDLCSSPAEDKKGGIRFGIVKIKCC